jgi:hypothetical protein
MLGYTIYQRRGSLDFSCEDSHLRCKDTPFTVHPMLAGPCSLSCQPSLAHHSFSVGIKARLTSLGIDVVPRRRNGHESNEDDRRVVHVDDSRRDGHGHAEQHQLKRNPDQRDDVDDWPDDGSAIPACLRDFGALVPEGDADGYG